MSVEQLAERCAGAGMPGLTVNALYALESGRRDRAGRRRRLVTVDELAALSAVFGVSTAHLMPIPEAGDGYPCGCATRVRALADELERAACRTVPIQAFVHVPPGSTAEMR